MKKKRQHRKKQRKQLFSADRGSKRPQHQRPPVKPETWHRDRMFEAYTRFPEPEGHLLPIALEAAVPLHIWELYEQGGPEPDDFEAARAFGRVLAANGD